MMKALDLLPVTVFISVRVCNLDECQVLESGLTVYRDPETLESSAMRLSTLKHY